MTLKWIVCSNCNESITTRYEECKYCGHKIDLVEPVNVSNDSNSRTKLILILVIIAVMLIFQWVSNSAKEREEEKLRAQIIKEEQAKQYENEQKQKKLAIEHMRSLSDKALIKLLIDCTSAITSKAEKNNNGPFGIALIDQYTSDLYIAAAEIKSSSSTASIKERIKDYRRIDKPEWFINSTFPILVTRDTFSGPKQDIELYECKYSISPAGMTISEVSKTW